VAALAAAAWVELTLVQSHHLGGVALHNHHHPRSAIGASWWSLAASSTVMVVAMMAPLTMPVARHVALTSLWPRRHGAEALFLAAYLAAWTVVAMGVTRAADVLTLVLGKFVALVITFDIATVWQLTPLKRRALRRCTRTRPLAARGWRADYDCVRFGVGSAASCVVTCWAFTIAAAAAQHRMPVMAALAALMLYERIDRQYSPLRSAGLVAALGIVTINAIGFAG
jgi:predicted metal-binding membrane protein